MDTTRIAKTTRVTRGIALAQEHFEEIAQVAPWIWSVPSATGSEAGAYTVDLKTGTCPCPDRTPAGETDKHVVAARYVKARTATCSGCGNRFHHRDLVEAPEGHLTFFEYDLVCEGCARDHGIT